MTSQKNRTVPTIKSKKVDIAMSHNLLRYTINKLIPHTEQ